MSNELPLCRLVVGRHFVPRRAPFKRPRRACVVSNELPLCRRVRCINLAGNSALSDRGLATLLASLPPGLEELDLSLTGVSNAGAALLSIKMPPGLRALNLYETSAGPAARRACALKLSPPELNQTGATRRLTKLTEPSPVLYSDPNGVGGMVRVYACLSKQQFA